VKTLIKCGALLNILDGKGRTALHYVAFKYRDDPADPRDIGGKIVVELCRAEHDVDFVEDHHQLSGSVQYDVDFVNRRDKDERTALHLAAEYGQQRTIKALIQCGATVAKEYVDIKGYTPIMSAAFSKETLQVTSHCYY